MLRPQDLIRTRLFFWCLVACIRIYFLPLELFQIFNSFFGSVRTLIGVLCYELTQALQTCNNNAVSVEWKEEATRRPRVVTSARCYHHHASCRFMTYNPNFIFDKMWKSLIGGENYDKRLADVFFFLPPRPPPQSTSGFELYLCFSPLATKALAMSAVTKLLKWIRKEEDRLFILNSLTY